MSPKCFLLFVALLMSVSFSHAATTGKIAGVVTEASTGEPLPGANIVIEGTQMGAASDMNGNYFIINIPPGTYKVRVSMIGYQDVIVSNVRVTIDQTTGLNFNLKQETIAGEEVTVVAQRPIIEKELTATKHTLTGDEMINSWVGNVKEAVSTQAGVNIHGGIRGGFTTKMSYHVDGISMRDEATYSNLTTVNTTSVEEMQVLTGGYNAEYGQATEAIINLVTKSARDRIHGNFQVKYRPAGKYHWGRNLYSKDNWEWRVMGQQDAWDPSKTGWNPANPNQAGSDGGMPDATPAERLALWKEFISAPALLTDYADRPDYEIEGSFYGPITSKLNFLVTGRYSRGAMKFPSPLEYSPDWNFQVKLNYDITQNTKLQINGMYTGADNAGSKMTNYLTSQTGGRQGEDFGSAYVPSYFISAYDDYKYWPYGAGNLNTPVPPEFIDMYSLQAKLTHVFNPSTYLDVMVYHNDFKLKSEWDFMSDNPNYRTYKAGGRFKPLNNPFYWGNDNGDVFKNNADTRNTTIKADFVSQINPIHQVKAGFTFSPQYISWTLHESNAISHLLYNDYYPNEFSPWEAGVYVQDKVEFRGLIMNLGLRFDMYNVNRKVSANPFDQYQWGIIGPGTVPNEIGIPHFDEDGPNAVKSPTQIALSPRIGISHPISETTVLHFMYGHFNMRPPWLMMGSQPGGALRKPLREEQLPTHGAFDPLAGDINNYHQYPNNTGNVQIDFEKIVQYEIGFKQNIQDKLGIDVTMYYKEGKDLATIGLKNDHSIASGFGTTTRRATRMAGQPEGNLNKVGKGRVGVIQMTTNVGYQDVRGVEVTLDTEFRRYVNFQVVYNYSQSTTGRHGFFQIYRDNSRAELLAAGYSEDQVDALRKLSEDDWYDVSLYDRGRTGNNNAYWNPANSIKLYANLNTPLEFGPKLGTFYPLGDWYLNIYSQWAQGRRYTWHAPDDPSDEPLNMRWKDHYKTNLRLAKGIRLMNNIRTELFMNIVNVFNDKTLRLPGNRDQYHLEGKLPFHPQTKEDLEWTWYEFSTLPREIYFGLRFEF